MKNISRRFLVRAGLYSLMPALCSQVAAIGRAASPRIDVSPACTEFAYVNSFVDAYARANTIESGAALRIIGIDDFLMDPPSAGRTVIALVGAMPFVVAVNFRGDPTVNAPRGLVARLATGDSNIKCGSNGFQSLGYLAARLFARMTETNISHQQYSSEDDCWKALDAGEVQLVFGALNKCLPYVAAGRILPIAIANWKRAPVYPGLPTFGEHGVPGFEVARWQVLSVETCPEQELVAARAAEIISQESIKSMTVQLGSAAPQYIGREAQVFVKTEMHRWRAIAS